MQERRSNSVRWVLAAVAVAAIAGGIVFVVTRQRLGPQPGPDETLTAEEARALIRDKNVGLGYLENQQLDQGLPLFIKIAERVPSDPLGARNLAVGRILALGDEAQPAEQADLDAAKEALEKLRLVGESEALHWLEFRVAVAERDFAKAEASLDAVLAQSPNDPSAWYARYRLARLADAEALPAEAAQALAKAVELSPTNAWLLVEWLRATGTQLSQDLDALQGDPAERTAGEAAIKTKYATLAERLEAARTAVQPFAYEIQTHARVDSLAMLAEAAEAARQEQWATAATRMRVLANVLLPHAAPDQQPVRRHPLEFVLDRFQPEFYERAGVVEVEQAPAIPVAFAASPDLQLPAELAQALGEVLDFALADFDLDGRLDIVALGTDAVAVYGRGDATQPWTELARADIEGFSHLVVQDLDADFDETRLAVQGEQPPEGPAPEGKAAGSPLLRNGCPSADVDVILYGPEGIALLENRFAADTRARTLVPIAADKLPPLSGNVLALACADLEADGDLDLVLATPEGLKLWANNSEWAFGDITSRSALPPELSDATQLVAGDLDRDVDIDLLVAAASGGGWLQNLRHGQFRWQPLDGDFAPLQSAKALALIEADGNASWDVVAAGASAMPLLRTQTPDAGVIRVSGSESVADFAATDLLVWDYDNDGFQDLLAWSADAIKLYRGLTDAKFGEIDLLSDQSPPSRARAGDLDNDGDEDLALLTQGRIVLLENDGGNANHWVDVTLQAQQIKGQQHSPSGRVSPYGVGCLLELKAGPRYQAKVVESQTTHFGLGKAEAADVIRVGWLNGVPQNIIQPAADTFVCEQQVLNTSCPYLYAWNGERFEFVTDLLWNAPLGLQLAEGQLAPWREWEYLKIPGEMLTAQDGHYVLQVTAEMWEAEYFDEVKLIAVDHPADVEIYSNEKVGPASMAEFKIHTARQRRGLVTAKNHAGRDLLPELKQHDGVYARTFERKLRQGVVEDHYVELELGKLDGAERVTLFLTGWFYPAATSINVALSQGGSVAPARPPSLEVPDGQGGWKELLPFMGFPGGKTKTIAVELDAAALRPPTRSVGESDTPARSASEGSARVRIRTSMELYWDHIFFTIDEPLAELRTTDLALVSADLHQRGFSRVVPDPNYGPEQFLYDDVSTLPKWPPIQGKFTRLGDVKELLVASDDKLLVMMAGDETTVRFAVPAEPPPPGWKRDFLLYNVGWDKDANLVTVLGQTVEPLPFRKMSAYPWPVDEEVPDSEEYRHYVRKYQTRDESGAYWQAVRRFPRAKPQTREDNHESHE